MNKKKVVFSEMHVHSPVLLKTIGYYTLNFVGGALFLTFGHHLIIIYN